MSGKVVEVSVKPIGRGEFFASVKVGRGVWNAPGGSAAQAALNAWTAYTSTYCDMAAALASFPRRHWVWQQRADRAGDEAVWRWSKSGTVAVGVEQ